MIQAPGLACTLNSAGYLAIVANGNVFVRFCGPQALPDDAHWHAYRRDDPRAHVSRVSPRDVVLAINHHVCRWHCSRDAFLTPCDSCRRPIIDDPAEVCCEQHSGCDTPSAHVNRPAALSLPS